MNKKLPLISLFIMSIVSILYWVLKPKEELYEAKWNAPDTTLAITVDGEISTTFPTTSEYTAKVECNTGSATIKWNGTKWVLTANRITNGNTKCNVTFKTGAPTFADIIISNNEVKAPLTTTSSEVSAHTIDDVAYTKTESVTSAYQSYYVTYGTGWEANGENFNLTGAAVTSGTYANSYSSLVGKYLPYASISSSSSNTAGTMVTTTNLPRLHYVVSATPSSYTYKILSSNKNVTEALLASTEDDYGTSYYFRGAVKNNYVQFANKCWRIVRIVGDGSVKLVLHNDNTTGTANPCASANNSNDAAFAHFNASNYKSEFNKNGSSDNAYNGFMYGELKSSTYADTHVNLTKSTILTNLETWYKNSLTSYENKIADTIWCNDKSCSSDRNDCAGENLGMYNSYNRIGKDGTPTLICQNDSKGGKLSKFTVNDTINGNGKLTYKIGLLTADEVAFIGYSYINETSGDNFLKRNYSTYLQENTGNNLWWTLSPTMSWPSYLEGGGTFNICLDDGYFAISCSVNSAYGVRPAISLVSSTTISGGTGTSDDPYVVN